ncbi:helix-turn-helix domain-containing protein [Mycobacterium sp. NPDC006124]|uniref:TetR/AcrR family transcriptional regulator n=1 Tax=Mycobacterium sp. NPDC006124 TaxID=3156729 RepID=UPI0033A741F4
MTTPRATPSPSRRGGRGARQRILDTAADLFYREGINATGVERLASEAAVSKRTLYQHFPSKDAVVEEYLRAFRERVGEPVRSDSTTAPTDPRSCLLALFKAPSPTGRMRGCPFHNAAVEAAEDMPAVHEIVRNHKREFVDGLVRLSKQAGARNPRALGNQLAVLYEGAAALSTSLDESAPWTHARRAAQTLVDGAVGH